MSLTDEEILVELRDIKQRVAVLIADTAERIAERERRVAKILAAVREAEVAEGMETCVHEAFIPDRILNQADGGGE